MNAKAFLIICLIAIMIIPTLNEIDARHLAEQPIPELEPFEFVNPTMTVTEIDFINDIPILDPLPSFEYVVTDDNYQYSLGDSTPLVTDDNDTLVITDLITGEVVSYLFHPLLIDDNCGINKADNFIALCGGGNGGRGTQPKDYTLMIIDVTDSTNPIIAAKHILTNYPSPGDVVNMYVYENYVIVNEDSEIGHSQGLRLFQIDDITPPIQLPTLTIIKDMINLRLTFVYLDATDEQLYGISNWIWDDFVLSTGPHEISIGEHTIEEFEMPPPNYFQSLGKNCVVNSISVNGTTFTAQAGDDIVCTFKSAITDPNWVR